MKKKALLSAVLSIVLCASLITGATMALFTSESKVNIAVSSGKVEVVATIGDLQYKALGDTDWKDATGNTVTFGDIGGSAVVEGNNVTIGGMVAGDYLQFNVYVTNKSTVSVNYRTVVACEKGFDLFAGLDVQVGGAVFNGLTVYANWELLAPNGGAEATEGNVTIVPVIVGIPESATSDLGGKEAVISYSVEAIQGNAEVVNPAENEVFVYNVNDMLGFAAAVNAGNSFKGKTVTLMADVDLASVNWEPIGQETSFAGTFNGNGKTIKNLTVNTTDKNAGLFANVSGKVQNLTVDTASVTNQIVNKAKISTGVVVGTASTHGVIENVTVKNATVNANRWAGGIVGYIYGDVINCTVTDSTINGTVNVVDGTARAVKYDNGDKVGGIIGYQGEGYYKITGNKVENVTVAAYRDFGGIVGHLNRNVTVENNTVNKLTLKYNIENLYSSTPANHGAIAGRMGTNAVCDETKNTIGEVVNPAFSGLGSMDDYIEIAPEADEDNGKPVNTIYVANAAALQAAIKAANSYDNFNIIITENIDISELTTAWESVSLNGYSLINKCKINIDGQGNTITNLTGPLLKGTWSTVYLTIKNLTIADSEIVEVTDYGTGAGAFLGVISCNPYTRLENCHLVSSSVTGGYWAGGLYGYAAGFSTQNNGPVFTEVEIINCSVKNSEITCPGSSAGAFAGHATGDAWTKVTIENPVIIGNTVVSNDDANNKAGWLIGTIGAAGSEAYGKTGGTYVTNVTASENAATSNGVVAERLVGRLGTPGGKMWLDGELYICDVQGLKEILTADDKATVTAYVDNNTYLTNVKIAGGKTITLNSNTKTVYAGQLFYSSGTLTINGGKYLVDSQIADNTGISQTGKSTIALWGEAQFYAKGVTFEMSLADSTAITSWWDTGIGTKISVYKCVFNANGQRPIRGNNHVDANECIFNDVYRYAVQLTAKASTATEVENAIINFKNNVINAGSTSSKTVVYGVQLEGGVYGCNNVVINGEGNVINANGTGKDCSTMYYCGCGKVDHNTIAWNVGTETVAHAN